LLRGAEKKQEISYILPRNENGSTGILNQGEGYWMFGLFFLRVRACLPACAYLV